MHTYPEENVLSIKAWAEADRPREKLLLKGRQNLTDAELLAIVLGSGSRSETAVGLAQRILSETGNNLNELGKRSIGELKKFKGVGEAKAISVIAALELGRRRQVSEVGTKPQISCSQHAYTAFASVLSDLPHEEFWILLLNRANRIIGKIQVSSGGISGTVVDAKILFRRAIEGNAVSVILGHNHPSGNTQPSQADLELTKKLVRAGETLDIGVLDHLILGDKGYFSFADESLLGG
ncbi:MAG: DNA repair protein RadC [Saprospiraceae bacterium]|nr:DNA repair protein RadC [Saprospiraceae bacterium]